MEWPPPTGPPFGSDPYPTSVYPPANPPWALRPGAATTYRSEQGDEVPPYPPNSFNEPRSEQYPPELGAHQHNFPPQLEPHNDSWLQRQEFHNSSTSFNLEPSYPNGGPAPNFGGANPHQLPYPYLHSTESLYPPSSFDSTTPSAPPPLHSTDSYPPSSVSASFFAPHGTMVGASTTSSAPSPPPDFPTAPPAAFHSPPTPAQPWGSAASSAPSVPSAGPGLSFGCAPPSVHPLLQSFEDDVIPYGAGDPSGGGGDEEDDPKPGGRGDEDFDYSHEALEKYGENLTTRAKDGSLDPVIGRDLVVRQCIEILTRKSKCNPVLVGHPGVGKTAVVEGLAQRIVKGDVPEQLRRCKIISVDLQNVTASTKWRGDFEQNMKELIDGATEAKRKVILFLDELHRIIGAGKVEDQVDTASEILKPALARGDFLCIGATTHDEYNKYVEQDQALARRFQKVIVDPPSPEDTVYILRGIKPQVESHHGISIADEALVEAVKLSERYIPDRYLPDKAIDLVDVAASKLKIALTTKPTILDEIDHAIMELDMERLSVASATTTGQASQQGRLQQILSDLEGLKLRQTNLTRKWKKEKALTSRILSLKEKITAAKTGSRPGASSNPSGLGSDAKESGGAREVHVLVSCDACHQCPIIGPRYSHESENMDLCESCRKLLSKNSGHWFANVNFDEFRLVKPNHVSCDGCLANPIIGIYYVNNQNRNNVLCKDCWCTWRTQFNSSVSHFECQVDLNGTQTEKSNGFVSANVKELEAQLEAAEREWKEYQNLYKPLMQLEVSSTVIAEVLSSRTGIPVAKMQASQAQQLLQLDVELHKRVIGQDEACNAIARAVQRSRAGLSDPKRPIASLMFMGPTGVGKTELSKALAIHLFNSENAMVRIDMSEFGDKHSISKLTGAAPGLVGHGDGGQLTTPVRRQPYSVVLFDEIEKADDDIFNIFLQILDDGRLTDSAGRVVNFTNTVIIMTSNVGAEKIMEVTANSNAYSSRNEAYQAMKSHAMEAAREKYRPEFINRIDEFIVFQPLNPQQICEIVKLQLERVSQRLQDRQINLRVSESALQLLSSMGYDPRYGARPVKRVIQQSIEDALAQGILRGQYTEGCTIMVDTEFSSLGPFQQPQQKLTFCKLP